MVRLFLGLFKQFTQSANFIWKLRCKLYATDYSTLTIEGENLLIKIDSLLYDLFQIVEQNGPTTTIKLKFLTDIQTVIATSFLNAENDFQHKFWITFKPSNSHLTRSLNLFDYQHVNPVNMKKCNQLSELLLDFDGQALRPHWLEYLAEVRISLTKHITNGILGKLYYRRC